MKPILLYLYLMCASLSAAAQHSTFRISRGQTLWVHIQPADHKPVVETAIEMLEGDLRRVLDVRLHTTKRQSHADVLLRTDPTLPPEGFRLTVDAHGTLLVAGADPHGMAYGLLELSRLMGVSPWEWWADSKPKPLTQMELPAGFHHETSPSVAYRGVFLNDEDWGINPWSWQTHEKGQPEGTIGPRTCERLFGLLLRLRANTFWPAMHECSVPFFLTPGNREVARRHGIHIGTSHCEPMACNANGEWKTRGQGDYNFITNREGVLRFWETRVAETARQEMIYTLGMRGIHDGRMQGVTTQEEHRLALTDIFRCQRELLSRHLGQPIEDIPQVFIPYKEVLDVYQDGLDVPDDVTLMWTDDNYGYIRHFPTEAERRRGGGNGLYYHVSYWGRPHDYLWLGTFPPALLQQQLTAAFDKGIRRMWILNVGDRKPLEYQTELFLDMAWDMERARQTGVAGHLERFLQREFGETNARILLPLMQEHYRLAYQRKPEFMGGTRTEESDRTYWNTLHDTEWSREQIHSRLAGYERIEQQADSLMRALPVAERDHFFHLVGYNVMAAAEMNKKHLHGQLGRHARADSLAGVSCEGASVHWLHAAAAHDSIAALTRTYNEGITNGGRWNLMMHDHPRGLTVFSPVARVNDPKPSSTLEWTALPNPSADTDGQALPQAEGLGWNANAFHLPAGKQVEYAIVARSDTLSLDIRCVPTHPMNESGTLRFELVIDEGSSDTIHIETRGRSETWKSNVLTNQTHHLITLPPSGDSHRLRLRSLDEGLILDGIYECRRKGLVN